MTTSTPSNAEEFKTKGAQRLSGAPWSAIILLAPVLVAGLFGPWIMPHDPMAIDLISPLQPPVWLEGGSSDHLLGTDQFGRDLLSRLIDGSRITFEVVTIGVVFAALIGVTAGMCAGYLGGWVDTVLMRIVDVKMSIPSILLTILIGGAIGGGFATILISIILVFWADYARIVRGETLTLRERGYVALARVANCSTARILTRHILPNLLPTCIVLVTLQLGRALIIEASITFIGLGIQPPAAAWGLLISDGRPFLATAWWIPVFAGLAISATVLGANILGDWLRDRLDPKHGQFR